MYDNIYYSDIRTYISLFNFCPVNIGTKMIVIILLSRFTSYRKCRLCNAFIHQTTHFILSDILSCVYAQHAAQRLLIDRYVCVLNINHCSFVQQNRINNDELLNDTYLVLSQMYIVVYIYIHAVYSVNTL